MMTTTCAEALLGIAIDAVIAIAAVTIVTNVRFISLHLLLQALPPFPETTPMQ
jgi:hypothetical protein